MKPKLVIIHIRQNNLYPWRSIQVGLERLGYKVNFGLHPVKNNDLLITWTPWKGTASHRIGERHKSNGGKWIVFENGYIPDIHGVKFYATGLNGYNGWGDHKHKHDDPSRWESWDLKIKKWKNNGEYTLVIGQFGHKDTRYSMPKEWPQKIINKLEEKNIIYRPKPSRQGRIPIGKFDLSENKLLIDDLNRAKCCYTWNSPSIAVACLLHGISVHISSMTHILFSLNYIDKNLYFSNRLELFQKLAWTQWSNEEIENGKPFIHLLEE